MRVLIVLSALTGLSQAVVVAPRQAISPSEVAVTSTILSTVTNTITTAYPVITTATTCDVNTVIPKGTCSAGAVWSLTGGNYYSQQCGASLVGGTVIRAYVEPVGAAATSICVSFCNALNNLKTAASSCNGIVFTTVGALYECFLNNGPVTQVPAPASVFNIVQLTTNPCVVTSTTFQTDISYETVTSTIEIFYTSTASTSVIVISSTDATINTSEIPSAASTTSISTLLPTNTTISTSEISSAATTTLIPTISPANTTIITSQPSAATPTLVFTNSSTSISTITSQTLSSAVPTLIFTNSSIPIFISPTTTTSAAAASSSTAGDDDNDNDGDDEDVCYYDDEEDEDEEEGDY